MDTNKMREQFEAWYVKKFHGGLRDQSTERWLSRDEVSDGYIYRDPQENWEAWKASREAVVVELPALGQPDGDHDESWHHIRNGTIDACKRVVEAQGLKVVP